MRKLSKPNNADGMKNAFKAGIWYTVSTLLVKSISIISTPIYTRMMGPGDYGISATYNTWYALLTIICTLNVGYSIGRAKVDFGERFDNYIGALQALCALVTIGLFIPVFIFITPVSEFAGMSEAATLCLFVYLLLGSSVAVYQGKYRFRYMYKPNIVIALFVAVGTVLFSVPLIYVMEEKAMGKIIGTTLPIVILAVYFWFDAIKNHYLNLKKEYVKYALLFSLPLIVHSLSIYVLGQSDRLMIKNMCGDVDAGIYSLVYQYALLVSMITHSINSAWNPWFHDNYALGNKELIKEKVKPLIIFGCYICLGCVAVAPEAVWLLGGKQYLVGLGLVVPIALGVAIEFVYTQYVIIEMHLKKTKYISIGTVIAAAVNLILNFIFIPIYGYVAAAYTTLISYVLLMLAHWVISRFILKVHIYKDRLIFLIILVTGALCYLMMLIFSIIWLRYVLMAGITVIAGFYYKDFIKSKLKKKKKTNEKTKRT